jgi:hypothetical protein
MVTADTAETDDAVHDLMPVEDTSQCNFNQNSPTDDCSTLSSSRAPSPVVDDGNPPHDSGEHSYNTEGETAFESTGRSVDGQASPVDSCDLPSTCSDGDRLLRQLSSTELYPGSPVTTRESLLLFSSLAECHNLSKKALSDTLQVVSIHLPHGPQ